MDGWQAVARTITDRMAERDMTQRELAEHSGVSVATLRELQHGVRRRRSAVMLAAISRALGLPDNHLRDLVRSDRSVSVSQESGAGELADRIVALERTVATLEARVSRVEKRAR